MQLRNVLALTALLGFSSLATPLAAQSTRDRLATLESSVLSLERLLENNQVMQTDLLRRIQELQTENQQLRNDIDQLQFESRQGADRQRQLYLDLDSRLQGLEARGAAPTDVAAAEQGGAAPARTDSESYQAAFELLKSGDYAGAQRAFEEFLALYAGSDMRGNAQYWLAETFYVSKDFPTALRNFEAVITDYPTTRKIPDAWLKVGYCNYELEKWDDARDALQTVVSRYKESTAARLAQQRLAQMQAAGR